MKTNKLFRIPFVKAEVIYSVFKKCNVFTLLQNGTLVPLYDFSGNASRSSLNSLRKFYPGAKVTFCCEASFYTQPSLLHLYNLAIPDCIVFF